MESPLSSSPILVGDGGRSGRRKKGSKKKEGEEGRGRSKNPFNQSCIRH
jgi:hypothetical protein